MSDAKLMEPKFRIEALQATRVVKDYLDDITYNSLVKATEHYLEKAFKAGERRALSSVKQT